ncbi:LysR family transcriptional regulator [Ectopseudomonas khazarica]|uniref:LysR family transcriptional regulator n=1 Tax=Ectopseudomonas khazarica TaxID=2502979 RepID=UPI003A957AF8
MAEIERLVARSFLATARCASFKQAARSLNMHPTVLRKQLRRLETSLGEALFVYQDRALALTSRGLSLQAELASRHRDLRPEVGFAERPELRLALPEWVLNDVLGRHLVAFLRRHAGVRLELLRQDQGPLLQSEVMIWLADPDQARPDPGFAMTRPQRLASVEFQACIGKRYARERRLPARLCDLHDYMLVQRPDTSASAVFAPWNALVDARGSAVTRAHSQQWTMELIRHAACIGLMPHYTSHIDANLQLLPGLFARPMRQSIWLACAPLSAQREDVMSLQALIHNAFAERRDWFAAGDE